MAFYLVCRGEALSHFPEWAKTHRNPSGGMLTTQRISELLVSLDEDGRQTFLAAWLKHRSESEYLCFDITSISSYSALNEHVKYGYNRDGEDLPQINLALLFGQKSMLPVYYRELPGNISDVRTLKHLLDTFSKLGMPKVHLVMDRGFYSTTNVDDLLARRTQVRDRGPHALQMASEFGGPTTGRYAAASEYEVDRGRDGLCCHMSPLLG